MKKSLFKWLKKWLITSLISNLLFTAITGGFLTAHAFESVENQPTVTVDLAITENSVTPDTINPEEGESMTVNYCINSYAYITAGIYQAVGSNSSKKVDVVNSYEFKAPGCYSFSWDGKNGTVGEVVPDGEYFYGVRADEYKPFSSGMDYKAEWIYVKTENDLEDKIKIMDVEVENSIFDPWDDQEAEITFITNKDSYITLKIYDEDNYKVKTLIDEEWYEKGEHSVDWDGEDIYGDIVDEGEYTYKLTAELEGEKDKERGTLIVRKDYDIDDSTIDPRLKYVYATKENFDPGRKEKTNIVFTLTAKADVKVTIYDKNDKKIDELMDSDDLEEGTYVVEWDGEEVLDEEGTYTYKIHAKNSKGEDTATGEIEIEEDDKSNKKPNVYKDKASPIPYKPKNGTLSISFTMDKDAEVTLEIRDGDNVIATPIEEYDIAEGYHTLGWDGKDEYGQYAENGIYTYKIIAENIKGKDVEKGNFSVEDTGKAKHPEGSCSVFSDVSENYKYCEAIEWAQDEGVFQGYTDGTFRPNHAINRVEALKVILESMDIKILGSTGENLGFPDIDRYGWYMPYLKTALALGIVNGYPDGTFKPANAVLRIEALVTMLNTGKAKYGIIIPTNNYSQPYYDTPNAPDTKWYLSYAWFAKANSLTDNDYYLYPGTYMTRGEMADMLYRYHKAGLDE